MYDRTEIERQIPHRAPFLFIDEVLELEPGRRARSRLRLSGEEPFFRGHFPDRPLMPGVLILEHMAQTAGFLVACARAGEASPGRLVFAGVERARFLGPVAPGDEIVTEVSAIKLFETMGLVQGESRVAGAPVARARLSFGVLPQRR